MKKPKYKTGYYARKHRKAKRDYNPVCDFKGKHKNTFMPAQHMED